MWRVLITQLSNRTELVLVLGADPPIPRSCLVKINGKIVSQQVIIPYK